MIQLKHVKKNRKTSSFQPRTVRLTKYCTLLTAAVFIDDERKIRIFIQLISADVD